jgi:hypothetical protein
MNFCFRKKLHFSLKSSFDYLKTKDALYYFSGSTVTEDLFKVNFKNPVPIKVGNFGG